ncbi:MAG: V-type ATP synthase subunit F [Sedimentisphaerales bacterium]|nr:V-type ATP synthase subunit F [Sedimentisphaerales bacterium]
MKYSIIGDEDTILGFGIVGVSGRAAADPDQAKRAFEETLQDRDAGIIIITERVADMIRPLVDKYTFTEKFPLVVEIPDRKGPKPGRPAMKELVNMAIGIKL